MFDFLRPEYCFRPKQGVKRLVAEIKAARPTIEKTPWGAQFNIFGNELHERALVTLGLSDLRTCELISRIVKNGDTVIDIGANIGIMTSLMSRRAGSHGRVFAFEPHPKTRERLQMNAELWAKSSLGFSETNILPYALSSHNIEATLVEPAQFNENSGIARISEVSSDSGTTFDVECRKFDDVFTLKEKVRLVKIDVEGHEDKVLEGMSESLSSGNISNIIIEEFRDLPSLACKTLESYGYHLYMIDRNFWGPRLIPVAVSPKILSGEATNLLAVLDNSSIDTLSSAGWTALKAK